MGRERKAIWVIRTQVLFSVRANKTLPAARVVYIISMKNEYWYEKQEEKHNSGEAASPFAITRFHFKLVSRLDYTGF